MNDELTTDYYKRVIAKKLFDGLRLLTWNPFLNVIQVVRPRERGRHSTRISPAITSGRATKLIEPVDVSLFQSVTQNCHDDWIAKKGCHRPRAGLKPPEVDMHLMWITHLILTW